MSLNLKLKNALLDYLDDEFPAGDVETKDSLIKYYNYNDDEMIGQVLDLIEFYKRGATLPNNIESGVYVPDNDSEAETVVYAVSEYDETTDYHDLIGIIDNPLLANKLINEEYESFEALSFDNSNPEVEWVKKIRSGLDGETYYVSLKKIKLNEIWEN
jgi:hypothetical protein